MVSPAARKVRNGQSTATKVFKHCVFFCLCLWFHLNFVGGISSCQSRTGWPFKVNQGFRHFVFYHLFFFLFDICGIQFNLGGVSCYKQGQEWQVKINQGFLSFFFVLCFSVLVFNNLGWLLYCKWSCGCQVKITESYKLNSDAGQGRSIFQLIWIDHHLQKMLSRQS